MLKINFISVKDTIKVANYKPLKCGQFTQDELIDKTYSL